MKKPISFNSKVENNRNMKTGRAKGTTKTGGRKAGTPNKVTGDLRQFVNDLLNENRSQIIDDLKAVEPAERLRVYEKLLNYAVPKINRTELEAGENLAKQITGMTIT